jgi:hypothetical protein
LVLQDFLTDFGVPRHIKSKHKGKVRKAEWDIPPKFFVVAKPSYPKEKSEITEVKPFLAHED